EPRLENERRERLSHVAEADEPDLRLFWHAIPLSVTDDRHSLCCPDLWRSRRDSDRHDDVGFVATPIHRKQDVMNRASANAKSQPTIRPAVQDDLDVLWDFLAMAAYEADAEAAKAIPGVAKYLVGWQRPGDFGFIAADNGEIIGAAWARRFSDKELTFPYG